MYNICLQELVKVKVTEKGYSQVKYKQSCTVLE